MAGAAFLQNQLDHSGGGPEMKAVVQIFSFEVVSRFAGALIVPLVIRVMTSSEYASYTFSVAVANAASGVLSNSFNRLYIVGQNRIFSGDVRTAMALVQALIISTFASLILLLGTGEKLATAALALLVFGICISDFVKTVFQREQQFLSLSLVELIRSVLSSITIAATVLWAGSLVKAWHVLGIQGLALLVVSAVVLWNSFKFRRDHLWFETRELAMGIARSPYGLLFGYFCLLAPMSQMDVLMLKWMGNEHTLAGYGSAFRYYSLLLMALNSIHLVLLPLIQSANDAASVQRVFRKQRQLLMVVVPVVIASIIAAQWFIPWVDKGKYPEAVAIFRVLACSSIVSLACSPYVHVLIKHEDFRFLFLFSFGLLLTSIAIYYLAVLRWGGLGASYACLATFGTLNIAVWLRARSKIWILIRPVCGII